VRNPRFHALLEDMSRVHDEKSHDYARDDNPYSNFEYAALVAAVFTDPVDRTFATQLGIKLARIAELTSAGKPPKNESLTDSFLDLANYAAIWASYRRPRE
jgi:hypothetical protein